MQTYYKHVAHNEPFVFQGTKFIKTNHQRGYLMVDGRKQFRTFKPSAIVETTEVADKCNEWRQVKV